MVKRFNESDGSWRDAKGRFTSPPPEAEDKFFDPGTDRWRFKAGEEKAGSFAPSPEPEPFPFSFSDPEGRRIDKETGEIVSRRSVSGFVGSQKRKGLQDSTIEDKVRDRYEKLYFNPMTGDIESKAQMKRRNRNLERARIFKSFVEATGEDYQFFQKKFKGVSTVDIRGKFLGINEQTGQVQYGDPSEQADEVFREIEQEIGFILVGEQVRLRFLQTP